jgi:hypothetical protein
MQINIRKTTSQVFLIFIPTKGFQEIPKDGVDEMTITTSDNFNLEGWLVKNSEEKRAPLIISFGGSGMESWNMPGGLLIRKSTNKRDNTSCPFRFTLGEENVAFVHLSLSVPTEGSSNEWYEPVTEEEYNKLK